MNTFSRTLIYRCVALSLLSAVFGAAYAADPDAIDTNASGIDTLVVTANRIPTERLRVGSTTYLITAEEIEQRQYRTVTDALRTVPGISVTRSGSFGGLSYVKMRGAASGQTLVLIDGVVVNDTTSPDGAYDFAFLNTADIERIEVLSGPQSTLYGGDAIGGVINIITKGVGEQTAISGYAEGGSYNTWRTGAQVSGAGDRVSGRAGVDYTESDGISKADENAGNSEDDNYDNIALSGQTQLRVTDDFSLTATGRYLESRTMYDGFVFDPNTSQFAFADADLRAKTKQYSGGVHGDYAALNGRFDNRLGIYYRAPKRDETGLDNFGSDGNGDRTTLAYQGLYEFAARHQLLIGAEYEQDQDKNPANLVGTPEEGTDEDQDSTGLYAMYQFAPVDSVDLTLGLRNDNYDGFDSETTGRVTGAWNIPDSGTTLRSSVGSGFKAPTLYQQNYFFGPVQPLDNLQPETSVGGDIGIEQQFDIAGIYMQATYFYDKVDDAITFVESFVPAYNARYENIDEVRRKGVELVWGGDILAGLTYRFTGAYVDARNETTNEKLSRVPDRTGAFNLTWTAQGGSNVFADLIAQSDQDDSQYSDATTPGFGVLNVGAAWQVNETWNLYTRIDNLLDKEYQEVLGYGTPDRSYFAGVRVSL